MNLNDTPVSRQPEGALPSEPLPTEDQLAQLEALGLLEVMVARWSYARVGTWIRSLAAIAGEGVEPETREPAHERAGAYGEYARGSER